MTRPFTALAWTAATATYLLIVLGAVVRITGSGMGCGDHWPLCNGRLFPPLDDLSTVIEWSHRLMAALVSLLVAALAASTWWLRRTRTAAGPAGYVALGLLVVQVLLGAVTVKLRLPPWTVILHLGTAMLLLAALIAAALGPAPGAGSTSAPGWRPGLVAAGLGFVTVLSGALTANLGAATACVGFPLCNGQILPEGNYLQHIHWAHRVLAYGVFVYLLIWTLRTRRTGPAVALALVMLQVALAGAMIVLTLPKPLQAAHAAVGTAVWASLVVVSRGREGL